MDKKKVLIAGKLPPPYIGPAVACEIIINSKLKEDFKLIHFDLSDHRDINTLAKIDFINSYLAVKQYVMLVWLIARHRPHLVYIPAGHTTIGYVRDAGYILIAKLFRCKVLTHLRGGYFKNWYNESSPALKWFIRNVHKKVNGQIVLGNNLRQLYNWLLPEENIYVVPNGGNYKVNFGERNHDKITILFLSNFIKTKGILEVLYSAPHVCSMYSGVQYVFAGEWRDEETKIAFTDFIKKHPRLPIINAGPVKGEQKLKLFSDVDIFVLPTYYRNEGHPWVIVEAMAAGLPIISTDHAAISESVINNVNGYLVEKKNTEQVAEKIKLLVGDKALRNKMGAESRKLYIENFTEDKMIERLGKVFINVIEEK